ncbi:MAG: glycosyltransferase [Candidatus Cloacimonetes bacterium]|nr:glycosyltransferase [Candidatus Cloacimonadota bacterium]
MPDFISIIVPVYNRADEISDFLQSFCEQSKKEDWEIIIVDDGSSDNLMEVFTAFQEKLPLKYFHQQNKGPGKARNLGMQEAAGNLFVFIDSDCTVPQNYIEILQNYLTEIEFDACGGPDTQRDDFPPFLKAVNYSMTSFLGTGGTRGSKGKSIARYYPRSFNMGVKKHVYEKIGGMNDLRHGQDMEFSNRIYRAGYKVVFLPDLVVYHKRRTNLSRFYKQVFNWGVTRINLGMIDKQMLKPVHALPAIIVTIFLFTLLTAIFFKWGRSVLYPELIAGICLAVFTFLQSTFRNHSALVGFLSIITLFTQVFAYGLGFLTGSIKRLFTPKGKWVTGYTRKYYK